MKKVILLLIGLLIINKVYAYENDYFYFDIDKSFKEQTIEDKKYIFSKDNEFISITINDNNNDYNVSKFTQKDIDKQKEIIIKEYTTKFKDYTSNVEITNIELKHTKDIDYLEYDIFYDTKSSIGYNIYQRCRMYTSNNYVYSILYNSDKEITNNDYLNTFKIKDSYLKKINLWVYAILLIVMLGLIIFIDHLLHKKRH